MMGGKLDVGDKRQKKAEDAANKSKSKREVEDTKSVNTMIRQMNITTIDVTCLRSTQLN